MKTVNVAANLRFPPDTKIRPNRSCQFADPSSEYDPEGRVPTSATPMAAVHCGLGCARGGPVLGRIKVKFISEQVFT